MMRTKNYGSIVREPAVVLESKPLRSDEDFESRRITLENIMLALNEVKISMVGIHGVGGVGKTTMAIRVGERAKAEKLFDLILMVVVGKRPNLRKIQSDIARFLDLRLGDLSLAERATQIRAEIKEINSVLIILDDVPERLNMEEVGVPLRDEHKGCKILVTSRFFDVCCVMEAQKIYAVESLLEEEGWILFQKMAGISVDFPDPHFAKHVAKECKGLPLALVIVGKALKGKKKRLWKYALQEITRAPPSEIPVVLSNVYRPVALGYNLLGNNAARFLFLFCSSFPEHHKISLEYLVGCAMGVNFGTGIKRLEDARYIVRCWVQILKDRCLLLERGTMHDELGKMHDEFFEMHDVVQDIAKLIAPRGLNYLLGVSDSNSRGNSTSHECTKRHDTPRHMLFVPRLTQEFASKCKHHPLDFSSCYEFTDLMLKSVPNLGTLIVPNLMCLLLRDPGINLQMLTDTKFLGKSLAKSRNPLMSNVRIPPRHRWVLPNHDIVDEAVSAKPPVRKMAQSRNPLKPNVPSKGRWVKLKIFDNVADEAVSAKLCVSQKARSRNPFKPKLPPKRGWVKWKIFDILVDEAVSAKLCVSQKPGSQSIPRVQAELKEQEESEGLQQPYLERQDLDSEASVQVPEGCHNVESLPTCNQEDNLETVPLSLAYSWSSFSVTTPEKRTTVKELGAEIAECFAERPFGRSVVGDEMSKIKSRQQIHESEEGITEQDKIKTTDTRIRGRNN